MLRFLILKNSIEINGTNLIMYFQVGEIEAVRLITNYKGKSKGYAYVQFMDEVRVTKELFLLYVHSFLCCYIV